MFRFSCVCDDCVTSHRLIICSLTLNSNFTEIPLYIITTTTTTTADCTPFVLLCWELFLSWLLWVSDVVIQGQSPTRQHFSYWPQPIP